MAHIHRRAGTFADRLSAIVTSLAVTTRSSFEGTTVRDINVNINDALDAALEMTFPASDPIAVFIRDDDAWDGATAHGWHSPTIHGHDDERPGS